MPELWIGLIVIVLILVAILVFLESNRKRFILSIEEKLKKYGTLEKANNVNHGYVLKTNTTTYHIKLIYAPGASEVSFNSKRHWQVFSGSKKLMLPTHGFQDKEGNKILLIYPQPGKIVKYINENEVVFVTLKMDVFGMNVVHINQLDAYFE